MNGLDEFLLEAVGVFVAITGLLIWLTYLEASLLRPRPARRSRMPTFNVRRDQAAADSDPPGPVD